MGGERNGFKVETTSAEHGNDCTSVKNKDETIEAEIGGQNTIRFMSVYKREEIDMQRFTG